MTERGIANEPDWEELTTYGAVPRARRRSLRHHRRRAHHQPQSIAHHRECPFVREELFIEKIIDGASHNGHYYWAKNSSHLSNSGLGAASAGDNLAGS